MLIREAESRIRARGIARVGLAAEQENAPALRLYARLGYQDAGLVCEGRYTWLDDEGAEHEEIETCRHGTRELTDDDPSLLTGFRPVGAAG